MITSSGLGSSRCLPIRYIRHHAFTYAHHAFFYFTSITTLGMNYGYKSRSKSAASAYRRRGGNYGGYSKKFGAFKKAGRKSTRQPLVAKRLSRREIKYDDDYFNLNSWEASSLNTTALSVGYMNWILGGVVATSTNVASAVSYPNNPGEYRVKSDDKVMMPNCLTNVTSGTSAKTRIGNLIAPRYITIKGVLNAARTNYANDAETTFKDSPGSDPLTIIPRYLRTSVKMYIIRDKSMNEKGYVTYQDVFEVPDQASSVVGGAAASNPFLWNRKVDVMSRYDIVKEFKFELDQDDPQVSFSYTIPLMGKTIRYNGAMQQQYAGYKNVGVENVDATGGLSWPVGMAGAQVRAVSFGTEAQSMTNGIYVLAVAHTGVLDALNAGNYISPTVVFSSRLTFEDN